MPLRQQIYDVLPGRPFGRATHGTNVTLSADPHTRRTATGTIGNNVLTLNSGGYSNGDLILIHQTRDPASETEDNYELALIVSGGGTTSLTLQDNLGRTYTDGTQVLDVREYRNVTISTWTVAEWNGSTGALFAIVDAGTTSGSGQIICNGGNGFPTSQDHSISSTDPNTWRATQAGGGFGAGWNTSDGNTAGAGEGIYGSFVTETKLRQGNGGGGNSGDQGSGGGNATAGGNGDGSQGGSAVGNTTLTSMHLGGGGGGTGAPAQDGPASGGRGGGAGWYWAKYWSNTGGIRLNGGNGGDSTNPPFGGSGVADGGGGAGGSFRGSFERAALGSNIIQAQKGVCPADTNSDGAQGRIAIFYGLEAPSGSTLPAATVTFDPFLVDPVGGFAVFF